MHANAALVTKRFTALGEHDAAPMKSCYHPRARFRDIAFELRTRDEIGDMWRMICSDDVGMKVLEFQVVEADDRAGRARVVEKYSFHTGKPAPDDKVAVTNAIDSRFEFRDGRIWRHTDDCDAKAWARQAIGDGIKGFLAGRFRLLRSLGARRKLARFVRREGESG
jgi:hypothetical protein